ncbi:hypothetical protein N7492_003654 [Penicillium capsulatum]|uniref:Rhodopsin domain-containing protein n=1 Tax=Penicillium capsulatum TaxID=69766 RepID=A0A9W9LX59_9EURO|nr:hypothetical protein N7492_003654 [Penicillium capsulatum]KAJ6121765.1 hypothetical protein N7512_004230 [Penicillium capsulatum]
MGGMFGFQPTHGGNVLFGVGVSLSVLQIAFVVARFYTRYLLRTRCGVDDYVILIALVCQNTTTVSEWHVEKFVIGGKSRKDHHPHLVETAGLGHHVDEFDDPSSNITFVRKVSRIQAFYALGILDFPFTVTPAKISLLLFYTRIFPVRGFQICAYIVGSLVLALGIAILFETIFHCSPISYDWDKSIDGGSCINQMVFHRVVTPINVFTGVLLLVLPMPLVWRLHAARGQKLALTGVFLLGGLGTVASILRMASYFVHKHAAPNDVTWFSIKVGLWAIVESAVIIIATCLVSIWPLITRLVPRLLLAALSCQLPRAREHRCWYLNTIHTQPKSQGDITPGHASPTSRDSSWSWSSPPSSLADLVDQRLWIFDEENPPPHYAEMVVANEQKF